MPKICDLIKKNQTKGKFHVFGLGSGVEKEFIKNAAEAGNGSHYFITDPSEINQTVMKALQSDFVDYIKIIETSFLDASNTIIKQHVNKEDLKHATKY